MDRPYGKGFATRSAVFAGRGAVATSQPLAARTALAVLERGGSAADAAIAGNALLALTEPTGCGLGGDLFALVWDPKERRLRGLNGSGRAPREASRERFIERGLSRIPARGPLSVTVPGCADAWFELHERFGHLPFAELLAPAIEYAREGFPVSPVIAWEWRHGARAVEDQPGFKEQLLIEGRAPLAGERFKNPNLARTFEQLAAGGRDAFYQGEIAERIERALDQVGGFLSKEDLADHRSEWVEPISTHYRGHEVCELPPNTQGLTVLQMLNLLEGYDLGAMDFADPRRIHLMVEAKKLCFEDRARWYADMDFAEIPVQELASKGYAKERGQRIDPECAASKVPPGHPALDSGDTVVLCTADQAGQMVVLLQSNFRGFGSGVAPDGLGFVLQNRGELFDLTPGRINSFEPQKRPFHTLIPAFVMRDGKPWLGFGVMGGATQPQAQVQVLSNLIDCGFDLQEAGDAPRWVHTGSSDPTGWRSADGGRVLLESGFPSALSRGLLSLGHDVGIGQGEFGGYQAIQRDPKSGVYQAASESRKDGLALGY